MPKTIIPVLGKPLIYWTLRRICNIQNLFEIIIPSHQSIQKELLTIIDDLKNKVGNSVVFKLVEGGKERIDSIRNAIESLNQEASIIAVHDAVRPMFSLPSVHNAIEKIDSGNTTSIVLGFPLRETIKKVDKTGWVVETPDRSDYMSIQTPQLFAADLFKEAYNKAEKESFFGTDDASVIEFYGEKVMIEQGNQENIKVTYPIDLLFIEQLLKKEQDV